MIQESKVIRFLAAVARFFQISFQNSRSCFNVMNFSGFLQAAFLKSLTCAALLRLPALYPRRLFDALDAVNARIEKSKVELFHPAISFPLVYLSFVAISSYTVSNLALFSILLGIAFFILGVRLSARLRFREIFLENYIERIAAILLAVGVLSLAYDLFYAGAIPLLEPAARRKLSVIFTMLASLTVPGGILAISVIGKHLRQGRIGIGEARIYAILVTLVVTFLISLLGFRTQTIVALLGCSISMYYLRILGITEILASFFAALFSISFLGYYRALTQGAMVGFFEVIGKRIGLTLGVYDYLIDRFWVFGANHGTVFLATFSSLFPFIPGPRLGPRTMVASIFEVREVSITSTLLGTVVLDFGIPGVIAFALVLGFVVGAAYHAMKQTKSYLATMIFSFLLAYVLVGIETGLVDFNVAMFFIVSFLILLASARP